MRYDETVDRGRRHEVVAVVLGAGILLVLNLVLFLRITVNNGDNGLRPVPGWAFSTVTSVIVIALTVLALRVVTERESRLRNANAILLALEGVTRSSLGRDSFTGLLDALAQGVADVIGSAAAVIAVVDDDRHTLRVQSVTGDCAVPVGTVISDRARLSAVAVREGRTAVAALDAGVDPAGDGLALCPGFQSVACPLLIEGEAIGALELSFVHGEDVSGDALRLLQVVADRVAVAVEGARLLEAERRSHLAADQARAHLSLIAQASHMLAMALSEAGPALSQLTKVLVPEFADWCIIELSDGSGRLQPLVWHHENAEVEARAAELFTRYRAWDGAPRQAMASGQSELRYGLCESRDAPHEKRRVDDFTALMHALNVDSVLMLPIRVRGLSLGAIVLGRGPERRGFRPSDQGAAEDIANRAGVALERVSLYQQTRAAAEATERTAEQLRRLVQAGLEITAPLSRPSVLRGLAEQARRVLGADRAIAKLEGPGAALHLSSPPGPRGDRVHDGPGRLETETLEVPIPSAEGTSATVLVQRSAPPFTAEDESFLASMAQMAATALEKARLYQAMASNEQQLGALVEAAPLAIIDLDMKHRPRTWNRAARELFGWPELAAVTAGRADVPLFPDATDAALEPLLDRAELGHSSLDQEIHAAGGDGPVHLSVSAVPLRDRFGEVNGMLAVLGDVSARKELEEQLVQSQRMEAIGRLAGGVAHDFNNLLTVILGYSDLLLRRLEADDTSRPDLEAIRSAGQQAANLTAQLLTVGRRQLVEPDVVAVHDVVSSIEEVVRRLTTEDIEVVVDMRDGHVLMDPTHIEQVVLNLVVNAGDAMPEGGRLTVAASEQVLTEQVSAVNGTVLPGRYVVLSVSDTGTGMPAEVIDQCFEPFYTTKPSGKGTGLGLATVYGIVTQSGGFIQIDTRLGVGTTIRVLLPAVDAPRPVPHRGLSAVHDNDGSNGASPGRGTECLLLVEDEAGLRQLAADVLVGRGYRVVQAGTAEEALRVARGYEGDFDLLVTDVILPGMDGVELAHRIGRLWPDVGVLFMSGYTGAVKEKLDTVAHGSNFLAKPFGPEELARRVRELLDARPTAAVRMTADSDI